MSDVDDLYQFDLEHGAFQSLENFDPT